MRPELWVIPGLNWPIKSYGFMLMIGFLTGVWFAMRRAMRVKADPDMILNCGFVALLSGVVGARLFYVIHYWKTDFAGTASPLWSAINITAGGMEAYGGLLAGLVSVFAYLAIKRQSWRLYLDIAAPAGMWGLGITRIGCFLNGCCWGGLCIDAQGHKALPWAVTFPFGSNAFIQQWDDRQVAIPAELIHSLSTAGVPISAEHLAASEATLKGPRRALEALQDEYSKVPASQRDNPAAKGLQQQIKRAEEEVRHHDAEYEDVLLAQQFASRVDPARVSSRSELEDLAAAHPARPVHPTQLYAAVNGILISFVLSAIFYRRKHHGVVVGWLFVLYGLARIVEEVLRVDNPLDSAGLTVSQFISVMMVLLGGVYLFVVYRVLPPRSPRAVAYVAPAL